VRLQSFDGGGARQAPKSEPHTALVDQAQAVELHERAAHVGGSHPQVTGHRPGLRAATAAQYEEGTEGFDEELLIHTPNMRTYCARVQFPVCSAWKCYDSANMSELPPCGLYRTTVAIGEVPAGHLVFFHNHGDPGPGVYVPTGWSGNRARFSDQGTTLPDPSVAATLEPLPAEGIYRVVSAFPCCEKNCRTFEPDMVVQLGYDAHAHAILFVPEWAPGAIAIPDRGTRIDRARTAHLALLKIAEPKPTTTSAPAGTPGGPTVH
jgi:hypothetical protein